jgi:hypothetical protein
LGNLQAAKSYILEWDSILRSYQIEFAGVSTYKNDMLAKVWGAFVHEQFNSSIDDRVAFNLYSDAENLLLKGYNAYPSYNRKNKKFSDDFEKLPYLTSSELKQNYIESTAKATDLENFINKKKNAKEKDNVVVLVKENLISQKTSKVIQIPLVLPQFSGDRYVNNLILATHATVEFPQIVNIKNSGNYVIKIYKDNTKIDETKLVLLQPLGEIAKKTLDEKMSALQAATIARIVAKYVAAFALTQQIYKNNGEIFAALSFIASQKAIEETSLADLRYWETLFNTLQIGSLKLKEGSYKMFLARGDINVADASFVVEKDKTTFIDLNI